MSLSFPQPREGISLNELSLQCLPEGSHPWSRNQVHLLSPCKLDHSLRELVQVVDDLAMIVASHERRLEGLEGEEQ
jgi:hypothetical protein